MNQNQPTPSAAALAQRAAEHIASAYDIGLTAQAIADAENNIASIIAEQIGLAELLEDRARLDWLIEYITDTGANGVKKISWTAYDEDGKSLMGRKVVSEDEVVEVNFDRAAIDAARRSLASPGAPGQGEKS